MEKDDLHQLIAICAAQTQALLALIDTVEDFVDPASHEFREQLIAYLRDRAEQAPAPLVHQALSDLADQASAERLGHTTSGTASTRSS
jgi:hypothetical protein